MWAWTPPAPPGLPTFHWSLLALPVLQSPHLCSTALSMGTAPILPVPLALDPYTCAESFLGPPATLHCSWGEWHRRGRGDVQLAQCLFHLSPKASPDEPVISHLTRSPAACFSWGNKPCSGRSGWCIPRGGSRSPAWHLVPLCTSKVTANKPNEATHCRFVGFQKHQIKQCYFCLVSSRAPSSSSSSSQACIHLLLPHKPSILLLPSLGKPPALDQIPRFWQQWMQPSPGKAAVLPALGHRSWPATKELGY